MFLFEPRKPPQGMTPTPLPPKLLPTTEPSKLFLSSIGLSLELSPETSPELSPGPYLGHHLPSFLGFLGSPLGS